MDEVDSVLKKYVRDDAGAMDNLRAAAFLVKDRTGRTLYSNAAGKLTFDPDSPAFTADSICWIASMTKLVTAVSAMQFVERNLITLDDDVGKYVSELANKDILKGFNDDGTPILVKQTKPITLRTLLSHSSGFANDNFDPTLMRWSAAVGRTPSFQSFTLESCNFPLLFEPGDSWSYGVGLDWTGHLIEVLSGSTLEEYMQANVFGPLAMSSTTFCISDHPELASRRAALGFRPSPRSPLLAGESPMPSIPAMQSGGAGLYSTLNDYAKLLCALVSSDSTLLKPASLQELFRPQLPDPKDLQAFFDGPAHDMACPEYPRSIAVNYTLGGAMNLEDIPGKRRKGSMMWSGLTNPHWWVDLETGIAAALFTQVLPVGDAVVIDLYNELERAVYRDLVKWAIA